MQTNPIATTTQAGKAQQAGKPEAGVETGFAALLQSLTGEVQAAAGAAGSGAQANAAGGKADAAEGNGEAQPTEGSSEGDVVAVLVAPLQGVEVPPPPLAASPPSASAGGATPQIATGTPEAPSAALIAPSAAAADPASTSADGDAVAPPSAQAVELTKVLGAGTQVHVTRPAEGSAPASQPVQGLAIVAVAAALEETAVTAVAEPLVLPGPTEPGKASSITAAFSAPADGATTASVGQMAVPPAKPTAAPHEKADAAPRAATGAADGAPTAPASLSSAVSLAPDSSAQGSGEAAELIRGGASGGLVVMHHDEQIASIRAEAFAEVPRRGSCRRRCRWPGAGRGRGRRRRRPDLANVLGLIGTRPRFLNGSPRAWRRPWRRVTRSPRRLSAGALRFATSALRKALPAFHRRLGEAEIEALAADIAGRMAEPVTLAVAVHPDLAASLQVRLEAVAAGCGLSGRLAVAAEPAMAEGDCRITWAGGGAKRQISALLARIEDIVRTVAGDEPDPALAETSGSIDHHG